MKVSRGDNLDRYYLIKLFGFGVFLHRIHHTDPEGVFHNHPWNGISFILKGEYMEEYADDPGSLQRRRWINKVAAQRHHRQIVQRPAWTLFIHGPKCNTWSVIKDGKTVDAPWENEHGHKSYTQALSTNSSS